MSRDMDAWLRHAEDELRPMIANTPVSLSILSKGGPDAKQAVEVGFILLLGKPLILAVEPGAKVPDGLARAAVEIIETDLASSDGAQKAALAIKAAIQRVTAPGGQTPLPEPHAEPAADCRECREGKHANCDGTTWDNELDERVPCECGRRGHR